MPEKSPPPPAFDEGTRLQFQSADLIRHAAELHERTARARRSFEAVRRRMLELQERLKLLA